MYYTIKVQIRGLTKPPVWRRFEVPGKSRLSDLHIAFQRAFGWAGGHLHAFSDMSMSWSSDDPTASYDSYGTSDASEDTDLAAEDFFNMVGYRSLYTYDFGDDWEHLITVETIHQGEARKGLRCIAGRGACPPDDCGGVGGYQEIKRLMMSTDPADDEERNQWLEWLGLDSPEEFDPNTCDYPAR